MISKILLPYLLIIFEFHFFAYVKSEDFIDKISKYMDDHQEKHIERLAEAVAIRSVSSQPECRNHTIHMVHWLAGQLRRLNVSVELVDIGETNWTDKLGQTQVLKLPPVILAKLDSSGASGVKKKRLLIYGHADVQPASLTDGWNSDPFNLTRINGSLYGRGATDDKGPVLGWLNAIEAYQSLGIELPIHLKFVFEAMEESNSVKLDVVLRERKHTFLANVDYVAINDDIWLDNTRPALKYGMRGNVGFEVVVKCAKRDLHSGTYGGAVHEAMTDLIAILDSLVHPNGTILVKGIMDDVLPLTADEIERYKKLSFNEHQFTQDIGVKSLVHDRISPLMNLWRYPSLSVHGIEGAFSEPGFKSVIPAQVVGKFSIRTVPNQTSDRVKQLVIDHIHQYWNTKLQKYSPNQLEVRSKNGSEPWITDVNNHNFKAAIRASKRIYGVEPDLALAGGTIPVAAMFGAVTNGAPLVMLSMGKSNDGMHSQNEKLDIENFVNGSKYLAAYLYELSVT